MPPGLDGTALDSAGPAPGSGRTAVQAHAVARVEAGPDGTARVVEARSAVPLVLRHTSTHPCGGYPEQPSTAPPEAVRPVTGLAPPALPTVTLHLLGAAAGPLAGDLLRLDVSVGPGVRLVLRSVAATLAMPGHGPGPSVLEIHAQVAGGGALDLLPEPTVAVRGCHHRMVGRAEVATGGWLRWREEIVLGRFGEAAGQVETDLRIDVGAQTGSLPLLRQQLTLGPDVPGLTGAALIGSARAVGSLLVAAPPAVSQDPGPSRPLRGDLRGTSAGTDSMAAVGGLGFEPAVFPAADGVMPGGAAVLPLAGPGVLITALAQDAVSLRRLLGG
jgi:urease accessory protein